MSSEYLSKEHQIIATMRKVLSSIIRDTTPPPGRPHPLRESTIEDVKQCFARAWTCAHAMPTNPKNHKW
jgi:hypothetical protein